MTLIMAARESDGTFIGADSRSSNDYAYSDRCDKLTRIHDYVLGVSGSSRVTQLIKFQTEQFDSIAEEADLFKFSNTLKRMVGDDFGVKTNDSEGEKFTVLMATAIGIYVVYKNFQFVSKPDSWAIGSGDDYGLGYYRALGLEDTELRVKTAIEATAKYVPSVGGPTHVLKVD